MAASSAWNLELAQTRLNTPAIRIALEGEAQRLKAILQPSHPDQIKACLGRLIVHCPVRNLEPSQFSILFEDYIEDLSPFPASYIAEACKQYRLNSENRFFPSVADLLARITVLLRPLQVRARTIERLLESMNHKPAAEQQRATTSDFEGLITALDAVDGPAIPATVQLPVTDQTYFESRMKQDEQPQPTEGTQL